MELFNFLSCKLVSSCHTCCHVNAGRHNFDSNPPEGGTFVATQRTSSKAPLYLPVYHTSLILPPSSESGSDHRDHGALLSVLSMSSTPVPLTATHHRLLDLEAFAALLGDGTVITWGDEEYGGPGSRRAAPRWGREDRQMDTTYSRIYSFKSLR